jgi:threonyl-tRNA synthetase
MFCLADSHIICQKEQTISELHQVIDLIEHVASVFGFEHGKEYRYRLSLGDREDQEKYYKDDQAWDYAEAVLRDVLVQRKTNYFEAENEAAFYGPKIDIQMKNIAGREDTAFTVQYDFVSPKRFGLTYIDSDGQEKEPIVIHRSSIGAIERTMAFLIEHYAGAFPVWLAPVQVVVIPVADRHLDYAEKIGAELKKDGIRVDVDTRSERMNLKIRQAQLDKVPCMVVVGDREVENETVSVRLRGGGQLPGEPFDRFCKAIKKTIAERARELVTLDS